LALVPVFTFGIYPLWSRFFAVTPLRKIGVGLFVTASSFLIVSHIEATIQAGHMISVWWQVLAYVVLTAGEVLVSITALEFSYKQAPLRMKSFIMALFLLAISVGNLLTAGVNHAMVRPLHTEGATVGNDTWIALDDVSGFVVGQKIDFSGSTGISVVQADGKVEPLAGTYLISEIETDAAQKRVRLIDTVDRKPVHTQGVLDVQRTQASTYRLVGPQYFDFFALLMAVVGVIFVFVAIRYKEKNHLRA
jgi:POT family proton-dependent oligopeptide transporter